MRSGDRHQQPRERGHRKAAEARYRPYLTTAADLAARCHRAAIEGRWATTMRFYAGPTLLVMTKPTTAHEWATSASNSGQDH